MRGLWALLLLAGARALGLGGLRLELARAEDARPLALLLSEAFDASSFALKARHRLPPSSRANRLLASGTRCGPTSCSCGTASTDSC